MKKQKKLKKKKEEEDALAARKKRVDPQPLEVVAGRAGGPARPTAAGSGHFHACRIALKTHSDM